MGQGGTCINVRTWVNGNELLGYTSSRQAALMNLNNCAACHTDKNISTMNHPVSPGTPSACAECHVAPLHAGAALDVSVSCGSCHDGDPGPAFSTSALQGYAADMHRSKPTANFNSNVDYSASYKLNFNAAASTCPPGYTCTYTWDFNNGEGTAAGSSASFTFAGTGPYPVSLTITTDAATSDSITKSVTPVAINAAPAVCSSGWTYSLKTVSFTDCSTDDGSATIYVNWGDGKPVQAYAMNQAGISHTYTYNGTYNITHWVQDSAGLKSTEVNTTTVPKKFKVTVNTSAATANALVRVKTVGGVIKSQGYTNAAGTFLSVGLDPAMYNVTISKYGFTFVCDTIGATVPADLTAANDTVACTVTP
jgi:PKD repeat protein